MIALIALVNISTHKIIMVISLCGRNNIQSLPEFDVYNLLLWSAVMVLCATSPGPGYLLVVRTSFSSVHIRSSLQKIFLLFSPSYFVPLMCQIK